MRLTLYILTGMVLLAQLVQAETKALYVVQHDGVTQAVALDRLKGLTYSNDGEQLILNDSVSIALSDIEQLTFGEQPEAVEVQYNGTSAQVLNPYCMDGVSATVDGTDVTIRNTNTEREIETRLSGESSDGSFLYVGSYKTTVALDGITLHNERGAALDIECGKRVALHLRKGTVNALSDGTGGSNKAALYCKGHLEIDKSGELSVTGNTGHAIQAKEYVMLKKSEGTVRVLGAVKDGIHCKQFLVTKGMTLDISGVQDDGIDVECDGEANDEGYDDGSMHLLGGTLKVQTTANAAKALAAEQDIVVNGASVSVVQSGTFVIDATAADTSTVAALRSGRDIVVQTGTLSVQSSAVCGKALSAEQDLLLQGGTIQIAMTGQGGKGGKADCNAVIGLADSGEGPTLTLSTTGAAYTWSTSTTNSSSNWGWGGPGGGGPGGGGFPGQSNSNNSSAKGIKAMGTITVYGGTSTITTSTDGAEGLEGKKGVSLCGGHHCLKCYDDCINSGGIVEFAGGTTVCWSNGNDAVDSNYGKRGAITVSGGNIFAYTTKGSPEEGLDCDNNSYIVVTGGIAVSAGGSQGGGSSSIGQASQGYYLGSAPTSYSSSYYYTLCNTSGTPVCTYKFGAACSNSLSLLTAPNLGKGSISVKYGSSRPSDCSDSVADLFFIAPTVTTTGSAKTMTAK